MTTDLTKRLDPAFGAITKRFHEDPQAFAEDFAPAWFQLTHCDMGPKARYLRPKVPKEELIWRDPLPSPTHSPTKSDIADLKARIAASGLTVSELVSVAWASASTFRGSDKRGGANGARPALAPQKDWAVNAIAVKTLPTLAAIQQGSGTASLADVIVVAGVVAGVVGVEQTVKSAGVAVDVPFAPGRVDATQAQTDPESFAALETLQDGCRNYRRSPIGALTEMPLIDRAHGAGAVPARHRRPEGRPAAPGRGNLDGGMHTWLWGNAIPTSWTCLRWRPRATTTPIRAWRRSRRRCWPSTRLTT